MSSLSNGVIVIAIEANSQGVLKALKTLSLPLSPNLWPDKLEISKKILNRTLVMSKDQGNSDYLHLKAL
jgi:hypothetical protein